MPYTRRTICYSPTNTVNFIHVQHSVSLGSGLIGLHESAVSLDFFTIINFIALILHILFYIALPLVFRSANTLVNSRYYISTCLSYACYHYRIAQYSGGGKALANQMSFANILSSQIPDLIKC